MSVTVMGTIIISLLTTRAVIFADIELCTHFRRNSCHT